MKNKKPRKRLRTIIVWVLWTLLLQFVLINISAALYADKLTHLSFATPEVTQKHSKNIFSKTWRLFAGPTFYKEVLTKTPGFAYTSITFKTKNDLSIDAWHGKVDSLPKGTVILFHGVGGNKAQIIDEATAFREFGYNVLLVDNRSHGKSDGEVTTIGFREAEDVKLAYDHILQSGEKNIFLWGSSMGAVEIMKAVSDYQLQPSGIIIEMPFLSLQSHLKGRARVFVFPEQPFAFLTTFWIGVERGFNGFKFRTSRYAKNIHCPVLEQYGDKDELVLKYETDAIFDALPSKNKKLVVYEGGQHESFLRKDPAIWKKEISLFLSGNTKPID